MAVLPLFMTTISNKLELDVPVERLFHFYADLENLAKMVPPKLNLRILRGGKLYCGSEVLVAIRPALVPFEVRWRLEITEFEENGHFTEELISGPFTRWRHRHEFKSLAENRSRVTDTITFGDPAGFVARVLPPSLIRGVLEESFEYREEVVRRHLEESQI